MLLKIWNKCGFWAAGFFIFLSISALPAFSPAAEEQYGPAESVRRDVEQDALEKAMRAFDAQDYNGAKIGFEMLSETAQNPEIGRRALFGLASVKLLLANTSGEYEDAISSWKKWTGQPDSLKGCEDPRMLTPFLLRLEPSIVGGAGNPPATKYRKAAKEAESRGGLMTREKEVQALKTKLALREREIRRLRHQLDSLEEIHRKYQEKKQEATL
jgi:hypothetical protein